MRACVSTFLAYHRGLHACWSSWFTCQHAITRANVSTWCAKVPNRVPIIELGVSPCQSAFSKHSSLRYYYIKNSIIYVILQLCISYVYVLYIKIALYFISILHFILKRNAEFFFFIIFFSLVRNENRKRPAFHTLQISRVFSNFVLELWSALVVDLK